MKQTFKLILTLVAIFFLFKTSNGQQFDWATTIKLKDNFYQYDIGETPSGSLLLMSKYTIRKDFRQNYYNPYDYFSFAKDNAITLVQFDKSGNLLAPIPFKFKNVLTTFYEAYVSDNVYFIYSSIANKKCFLFADVYSFDGKYVRTETLKEATKYYTDDDAFTSNFNVFLSENHESIAIRDNQNISFYDKSLKKIWDTLFNYKYMSDMEVLDNGKAFAIGGTDNSTSLVAFDIPAKTVKTSEIKIDANDEAADICLKASEDIVLVAYQYGNHNKKPTITFGPRKSIQIYADGIVIETFDVQTAVSKARAKVPFSVKVLTTVTEQKKIEKIKGLEWLNIRNMYITEAGEPIVLLEKEYSIATSTQDQYGRTIKTEYSTVNEDIVCIKQKGNGSSEQEVIERKTKGRSVYDYMFSSVSFYEKGKLYIMYNEGTSSYKLINRVLSSDLRQLSMVEMKTYSEHDVYLSLRNARKVKEGQYKIIGRENKNNNSVILKF
jgi:hypothetical protein